MKRIIRTARNLTIVDVNPEATTVMMRATDTDAKGDETTAPTQDDAHGARPHLLIDDLAAPLSHHTSPNAHTDTNPPAKGLPVITIVAVTTGLQQTHQHHHNTAVPRNGSDHHHRFPITTKATMTRIATIITADDVEQGTDHQGDRIRNGKTDRPNGHLITAPPQNGPVVIRLV